MRVRPFFYLSLFFSILFSCSDDDQGNPNVVTIQDKEYATMVIGDQTWTIENYSGEGGIAYSGYNSKPEYGRYYTFQEVKAITLPSGWRLPTQQDFIELAVASGITIENDRALSETVRALTSTTNWLNINGTNASGFNAYPAGYSFDNSSPIDGDIAEFWASEQLTFSLQEGADKKRMKLLFYSSDNSPLYRFNVRFVKDN